MLLSQHRAGHAPHEAALRRLRHSVTIDYRKEAHMAHNRGTAFLLKIGDGTPKSYATVAGLKTTKLSINGDPVTVPSTGWRELLPGAGVRSVGIEASGIFTSSAADAQRTHP